MSSTRVAPTPGSQARSGRAEDPDQQVEPGLATAPSASQLLGAQPPPDPPEDQDRDHDVVQRPDHRHEIRDQVDGAHEPGEQPDECDANPDWRIPVGDEVADQPNDIGHRSDQLADADIARPKHPEDRHQSRPQEEQPHQEADDNIRNGGPPRLPDDKVQV